MVVAVQHLQHRSRQLQRPLHRLVRIGVRPQRQRPRGIARLAQLLLQQLRHLRLEDQLGFEIEAGRIPEIGVRRPRVAIDAAVLAAAIRIDRAVEADIGRAVPADRRLRRIRVSVVASFGSSPNSAVSVSQPSSNGLITWLSNRTGGLVTAPRPLRASDGMLPASASSRMVRSPSVRSQFGKPTGRSRTIWEHAIPSSSRR